MKRSSAATFIIFTVFNLLLVYFLKIQITLHQVLSIHVFLLLIFLLNDLVREKISNSKKPNPLLLLSLNFLRIISCIIFLLPTILNDEKFVTIYIYNFFICYFGYLFCDLFLKRKILIK